MEIFAVTKTSVYSVKDERDENGVPIVEKIAVRGRSRVAVGQRLRDGSYAGITPEGIILYEDDHPRHLGRPHHRPEEVSTAFYGGHTSPIVALFLDKDRAMACFDSEGLMPSDPRWEAETKEALSSIGDNNPVLVISYWSSNPSKFHFPS